MSGCGTGSHSITGSQSQVSNFCEHHLIIQVIERKAQIKYYEPFGQITLDDCKTTHFPPEDFKIAPFGTLYPGCTLKIT